MKDILTKVGRNDGMTVPDGYFDGFASRMAAALPQQEWEKPQPKVMPRSMWQRIRPYVYMAAMFMGVWCMMKMFDLMRADSSGLSIDNNPVMTAALDNDSFINDYFINEGEINDYQLMEDLYETGFDPADAASGFIIEDSDTSMAVPEEPGFPMAEV